MSSAVDLKSKEEKDAELDKRIEALRKKNEALMKRYQEIEEDRKKAEQEGIAVTTPRKIKQLEDEPSKRRKEKENFSITIGLNSAEKRVVRDRGSPNSSSDAPCSPDQTFPRSPPHRIRGGIGRSPCIERSDIPSWEASGGLGGGVRGERGRRSRGGRSRGSARERIGGGKRGGRFREWEERGEGGELFGEREETVGRFSGRPSSDKEERSSRFCEREEYGGGDDKKVGRFIEQVENDGAREEQGGRSSRWEYKRGRGSHRGGTMSEKEEKGGKGNDLGGSFCEREDLGGGDREGRRGGGVGKLKQGGKSGRGIGGGGVKECGSGSDEWGSGGGDSDEWGIGGAGGDEWVGGNESRECSGRVRGGALDGKGGIVKAKKTGSIAFSEHREESGSMGPSSEGGGVGGPERKVKDWEEKRRQNIEKMNEEMEKIAEYERSQREGVREKNPFRNFLDDPRRCGPIIEIDRKEGSRRHVRNWGGSDFDRLKTGLEREKVPHGRRQSPRNADDMTLSMTGRERAEYMRWKTEREQIDQERLARHRKPTGQWRREWDAEKNESMFKEGSAPVIASDEGNRFDENKRPPKPPTFGDFSAEGKAPSSGKNKGRPRERRPPKAYSMHDNRWEENAAQLEGVAVEKESNVEKQEEIKNATLPDNTEQQDVDDDDQWEDASEDEEEMFGEEEYEEEIVEEEAVVVNEEEEKDELVGLVMEREQKQQEKQTVKVDDAKNVVVKKDDTNKQAQSLPAEPTKNERTPAPKLTIDIPVEATVEKSLESKPLSPFSPDGGHNPVLDWGAEMDNELRTPQSSSEDSPPQADTRTSHRVGSDASESQKNSLSDVFEAPGVNSPEDLTRFSHPQDVREDTEEARCFSHTRKSTEYVKNETECEASDTAQTVETAECERENHPVTGAVQITNFETVCFRKD